MAVVKKAAKSKAVALYDEKLAEIAKLYQTAEKNSAERPFFGTRGGVLTFEEERMPNNRMAVIILDSIHENIFFEGEFDPEVKASAACFAFSRDPDVVELIPHADSPSPQSETCATCENNKFGSAIKGAGKACKNTRRLALIPAGVINKQGVFEAFEDIEQLKSSVVGYLKLPVTSTKAYGMYVKQLASTMRKPPFGVVTKIELLQHADNVFEVTFEAIEAVSNDLLGMLIERHEETAATIEFPYQKFEEAAPAKSKKTIDRKGKTAPANKVAGKVAGKVATGKKKY